ncbi:sulfatase-like hydrolase/transferase [Mesorhizobium sp.]|uniref:sulfatase-like hydrolase/transferase n=1 Tax=Mesorhizobium sp. TaxID=1871066 RepID=UPI000FE4531E|nr:sulfatase-like hydrolase/transferase [Mesorhizobium sp.]RWQ55898.1 MAG: hypothetical protein EOS83_16120 [Mesorhizobium sp.]
MLGDREGGGMEASMREGRSLLALKCALLLAVILLTNHGLIDRIRLLIDDQRQLTLMIFSIIWVISVLAVLAAAFHPNWIIRLLWAVPLAISSAAAHGYYLVQGSEFFIFDVLNFWTVRHEAHRASEFYSNAIWWSVAVAILGVVAIAMPPSLPPLATRKTRYWSPLVPMLPIVLIAGVVIYREGKGSEALPKQFSPLSLVAIAAYKVNSGAFPEREIVSMTPERKQARAIVLLVDESIRSDFVSLEPRNPVTPQLAELRSRLIDFGPAVSGSNCSLQSNALLRFMAYPRDLIQSVRASPTVWQYAKRAGYRTVFIDAQAGFVTVYGKLQNYMTPAEAISIDRFYKLDNAIRTHDLDDELVNIVLKEMSVGDPVFIYANKNGAHFPYSDGSPAEFASDAGTSGTLQSYANAVRWSTDRTLSRLIDGADWRDATMIYTSDHGQNFSVGRLTHCSSYTNVDPNEAIVPMLVSTGDEELRARFEKVATQYPNMATHFAIAPTLLELMGYRPSEISARYESSLLHSLTSQLQFVTDDILGLFSNRPAWHSVDPTIQKGRQRLDLLVTLTNSRPNICEGGIGCVAEPEPISSE